MRAKSPSLPTAGRPQRDLFLVPAYRRQASPLKVVRQGVNSLRLCVFARINILKSFKTRKGAKPQRGLFLVPAYRRQAYPLWRVFADKKQKSPSKFLMKGY